MGKKWNLETKKSEMASFEPLYQTMPEPDLPLDFSVTISVILSSLSSFFFYFSPFLPLLFCLSQVWLGFLSQWCVFSISPHVWLQPSWTYRKAASLCNHCSSSQKNLSLRIQNNWKTSRQLKQNLFLLGESVLQINKNMHVYIVKYKLIFPGL